MLLLPSRIGSRRKEKAEHRQLTLQPAEARPLRRMGNGTWWRKRKKKEIKKKKERKKRRVPAPSAHDPKEKGKLPRRSPTARSADAIRVSAKEGESYAEILKAINAKVDPQNSGAKSSPSEEQGGRRSFWS